MYSIRENILFGLPYLCMAATPAVILAMIGIGWLLITGKPKGFWPFT